MNSNFYSIYNLYIMKTSLSKIRIKPIVKLKIYFFFEFSLYIPFNKDSHLRKLKHLNYLPVNPFLTPPFPFNYWYFKITSIPQGEINSPCSNERLEHLCCEFHVTWFSSSKLRNYQSLSREHVICQDCKWCVTVQMLKMCRVCQPYINNQNIAQIDT